MNRAIAKRPYFESREDKRFFLSRLARQVRCGRLEVHAFCLMTTHFHLLVRSPMGMLSEAMRRIQNAYSRYFNRRRKRDGPLIRARFYSKRVDTEEYRIAVVRYIDSNAVRAGLVTTAAEHEFGSASAYVIGPSPRWLERGWVDRRVRSVVGRSSKSAQGYLRAFSRGSEEEVEETVELVEARLESSRELDPLDDLVGSTPAEIRRWMRSKARLADGMEVGLPVCGPSAVARGIEAQLRESGEWLIDGERSVLRGSELARAGLLSDLCGEPLAGIGKRLGLSVWKATRYVDLHRALVRSDSRYAERVARVAQEALG